MCTTNPPVACVDLLGSGLIDSQMSSSPADYIPAYSYYYYHYYY